MTANQLRLTRVRRSTPMLAIAASGLRMVWCAITCVAWVSAACAQGANGDVGFMIVPTNKAGISGELTVDGVGLGMEPSLFTDSLLSQGWTTPGSSGATPPQVLNYEASPQFSYMLMIRYIRPGSGDPVADYRNSDSVLVVKEVLKAFHLGPNRPQNPFQAALETVIAEYGQPDICDGERNFTFDVPVNCSWTRSKDGKLHTLFWQGGFRPTLKLVAGKGLSVSENEDATKTEPPQNASPASTAGVEKSQPEPQQAIDCSRDDLSFMDALTCAANAPIPK